MLDIFYATDQKETCPVCGCPVLLSEEYLAGNLSADTITCSYCGYVYLLLHEEVS